MKSPADRNTVIRICIQKVPVSHGITNVLGLEKSGCSIKQLTSLLVGNSCFCPKYLHKNRGVIFRVSQKIHLLFCCKSGGQKDALIVE